MERTSNKPKQEKPVKKYNDSYLDSLDEPPKKQNE